MNLLIFLLIIAVKEPRCIRQCALDLELLLSSVPSPPWVQLSHSALDGQIGFQVKGVTTIAVETNSLRFFFIYLRHRHGTTEGGRGLRMRYAFTVTLCFNM